MGNCCVFTECVRNNVTIRKRRKKIVLLLVGLDSSGKTATAKGLLKENVRDTVPTVGFSTYNLSYKRYSVILYDLGGGPQIRDIWSQYYVDVHGIIYVIDASDPSRINESCAIIQDLLTHEKLKGKPLLLLANKQDVEGALDEIDVVERLNLEAIVNEQKCPTLVETCCAVPAPSNSKLQKAYRDPGIQNGFRWILNIIMKDYHNINSRVERDSHLAKTELIAEREKRRQRLEEQRRQQEEVEGTIIIPLRSSSSESNGSSRIITVQSSPDGVEATQEIASGESLAAQPSDSQDSGYNVQNGEGDSLKTVQSSDSAIHSMLIDRAEDNISSNETASHGGNSKRLLRSKPFMKRSNKTAPAPATSPASAEMKPVFTRHKLPPLTPPPKHIKMFEVKSNRRTNFIKSASLSFDKSESEVADEEMSLNLVRFSSDWKLLRHVKGGEGDTSTQHQRGDTSSFGKTFVVEGSSQSPLNNTET